MNIEDVIKTSSSLPILKKAIVNLLYTGNWFSDKMNIELKIHDISMQQFNVLRILKGQKGKPANLCDIQERMVNKMSNTTRLVDKLIKRDLVKRVQCKTNRRKIEITITSEGSEFLNKLNPIIDGFEKTTISNLTEKELIQLNNLLNKLRS